MDDHGVEIYEDLVEGNDDNVGETRERVLEAANGMEMHVELYGPDPDEILDDLNKLPDGMLELFAGQGIEDPEEAREEAAEQDLIKHLNGDAVNAFRSICASGMRHKGELTSIEMEQLVHELSLDVLFPLGAEIIELSLDNTGAIDGFRQPA